MCVLELIGDLGIDIYVDVIGMVYVKMFLELFVLMINGIVENEHAIIEL